MGWLGAGRTSLPPFRGVSATLHEGHGAAASAAAAEGGGNAVGSRKTNRDVSPDRHCIVVAGGGNEWDREGLASEGAR